MVVGGGALRGLVAVTSASSHALTLSDAVLSFSRLLIFPPSASAAG